MDLTQNSTFVCCRLYAVHKNSLEDARTTCEELLRDALLENDLQRAEWCEKTLHEIWRIRRRMIIPGSI
jgi:hypothetical protein